MAEREAFLKDNCEAVEEKGYMKMFTPEQLQGVKEDLVTLLIRIETVESGKKAAARAYKAELKSLLEQRQQALQSYRQKSEYVREICYKFVDKEERRACYFNAGGDLIESRPATADELQLKLFLKTGTSS